MVSREQPTTIRAKYIFTGLGPPISNGVLRYNSHEILYVGKPDGPALDLGDVVILPGLVNAHTHLEFSQLTAPLLPAGAEFASWIRRVVRWRGEQQGAGVPGTDWRTAAVASGRYEQLAAGTTLWGEISTPPWSPVLYASESLDDHLKVIAAGKEGADSCRIASLLTNSGNTEIRASESTSTLAEAQDRLSEGKRRGQQGVIFFELLGFREERHPILQNLAREFLHDPRTGQLPLEAGLSPHAPYTVAPRFLEWVVALAKHERRRLAMHLAESRAELELLSTSTGSLRTLLEEVGAWQPGQIPLGSRPLDYLRLLASAHHSLVVHGNYLDAEEMAFLAQQRQRLTVVYCPRTHQYFGHDAYPLAKLLGAGARVALGTDSRASNPDLSLLNELRTVAARHPDIAPELILRMGTRYGAEALGAESCTGSLEAGKSADFVILPIEQASTADPYAIWLDSRQSPLAVFRGGIGWLVSRS